MEKQAKILVTGASGLIGGALAQLLMAEGYKNLLIPSHKEVDLCDQLMTFKYFDRHHPQYVFHLAAYVGGIKDNSEHPGKFIYKNTMMHCNVFDACNYLQIKKLLFPGSACAYPKDAEQPIKESSFLQGMPEPTNLAYAVAKINGIVMAQSYAKEYGMNVVLPMVANTYGIGDASSHVIPMLIQKIRDAKEHDIMPIIWGSGNPLREFIYADDVASAFLFLMKNYDNAEIINVGSGYEQTVGGLLSMIIGLLDYHGGVSRDSSMYEGVMRKCLDSSKLYAMGWKPKVSLEKGLRRVIAN